MAVWLHAGTNNEDLLSDPMYRGLRQPRASTEEYDAFIDEFMSAIKTWQPHVLVQFEDFGNCNAFR